MTRISESRLLWVWIESIKAAPEDLRVGAYVYLGINCSRRAVLGYQKVGTCACVDIDCSRTAPRHLRVDFCVLVHTAELHQDT